MTVFPHFLFQQAYKAGEHFAQTYPTSLINMGQEVPSSSAPSRNVMSHTSTNTNLTSNDIPLSTSTNSSSNNSTNSSTKSNFIGYRSQIPPSINDSSKSDSSTNVDSVTSQNSQRRSVLSFMTSQERYHLISKIEKQLISLTEWNGPEKTSKWCRFCFFILNPFLKPPFGSKEVAVLYPLTM